MLLFLRNQLWVAVELDDGGRGRGSGRGVAGGGGVKPHSFLGVPFFCIVPDIKQEG